MTEIRIEIPHAAVVDVVDVELEKLAAIRAVVDDAMGRLTAIKTLAEELAEIGGQVEGDGPADGKEAVPHTPGRSVSSSALTPGSSSSTRSPAKPATSPVKPAAGAEAVLMFVRDARRPVKSSEIIDELDIPQSTVYAILAKLVKDELLVTDREGRSRTYKIKPPAPPPAPEPAPESQGGGLVPAPPVDQPAAAPRSKPAGTLDERQAMLRSEVLKAVDCWADPVTARTIAEELVRNNAEIAAVMRDLARDGGPLVELYNAGITSYRRRSEA